MPKSFSSDTFAPLCPRCGKALEWRCWSDTGSAYCTAHQTRRIVPGEAAGCTYQVGLRRIEGDRLVLVPVRDKVKKTRVRQLKAL